MEAKDIQPCARIIAAHPIIGPRYGSAIRDLGPAWLRLLGSDGFIASVFETVQEPKPQVVGVGISVFVTDAFIRELKAEPSFWIGPELTRRIMRGDFPTLSLKEIREANSGDGLNVAVWQTGALPEDLVQVEVGATIMNAFVAAHRGFRLREIVTQAESASHAYALGISGGFLWRRDHFEDFGNRALEELVREPHVIGVSRDLALMPPGSWIASMFLYKSPCFGFNPSEQRLLLSGLEGGTDEELAKILGISIATVKKRWRAIYDRVASCAPELALYEEQEPGPERGKQKKQRLLAYLRDHPEELRPVSRKLLRMSTMLPRLQE